ncbi:DUF2809 domain-containing protein [Sphaerisporangium sp. NPDC051017]|uniref:ribosomal maturation YjgA family protein n=1 Tax=Sphaerisporangium sp. NPDC051017 TaxID=3154636 RepID=UPI003413A753
MSDFRLVRRGGGALRARLAAGVAVVGTVVAGLGVRALAGGDFAKYAGDALYTVLVYGLVVLAAPRVRPVTAAGTALAVSWIVEFAQLSGVPAELSRHSALARLVLGSTFNAPDLFWYAAGAGTALLVHAAGRARSRGSPSTCSAEAQSFTSGPGERPFTM